ncbi:unnamed protein product [Caenorhabditis nigoni]
MGCRMVFRIYRLALVCAHLLDLPHHSRIHPYTSEISSMSRKRRNQDPEKIEKKKAIAIEQADRVERRNLYWSPRFILYRWIFLTLTFIQLGLLIKALMRKYITGAG